MTQVIKTRHSRVILVQSNGAKREICVQFFFKEDWTGQTDLKGTEGTEPQCNTFDANSIKSSMKKRNKRCTISNYASASSRGL